MSHMDDDRAEECAVAYCHLPTHIRGICYTHYQHQLQNLSNAEPIRAVMSPPKRRRSVKGSDRWQARPDELWTCHCPDARRDDWECPTCHRPSFSAERVAALTNGGAG